MENITLGQIATLLAFIVALITSIKYLKNEIDKSISKTLEPINKKIDELDINQCRNYLVDFLTDKENGVKKDDIQSKRAYEIYDHYKNDLKGNSYIHDKWNKLMK